MRSFPGARRAWLHTVLLLAALVAVAPRVSAQTVSGTVRDSASQLPLPNARVLVLDPAGRTTAQSTTDPQGRFRLAPWTGRAARIAAPLRLRVVRMGFRPREVAVTRAAAATPIEVSLASFPIVLEEVQVMAAACPKRPDRATALAVLRQVRQALYTSVLARSQSSATMTRLLYDRRIESGSGRILSQQVRRRVTSARSEPFTAARSVSLIGRSGFTSDGTGFHAYVGPDAETLIDDAFAQRYCVKMAPPDRDRPELVGLGFEPVVLDEGSVEMVGTVWVDTLARVLKDLNFRYLGLDRETEALKPQGRLSFRELPNGVVIIDQWSMRLTSERARALAGGGATPEIGGEIASASWPDGSHWRGSFGTMRLHVVDGEGRPAAAAAVKLEDTDYEVSLDSSGIAVLGDLLPGPYTASVRDPRLVALGIPSNTTLRFTAQRDSTKESLIQVETAEDVVRRRCTQDTPSGRGMVLARVVGPDGRPVTNARWSIRDEFGTGLVEDGRVDAEGFFQWCQLPLNKRVMIDVWRDDKRVNESRIVMERLTTLHFVLQ